MTSDKRLFRRLPGAPSAAGKAMGRMWRTVLRQRVCGMIALLRARGLDEKALARRAKAFGKVLARAAPSWIDQTAAMAAAAGVCLEDVLLLNCPPAIRRSNCSTFCFVEPARTGLLKLRDLDPGVQCAFVASTAGFQVQAATDIGDIGYGHFLSSRGIAGANNTGSVLKNAPDDPCRLNDCHIMRYFAERAHSLKDIPRLCERLLDRKLVGLCSGNHGMIFVFAGRDGGLVIELTPSDFAVKRVRRGYHATANDFLTPAGRRWAARGRNTDSAARLSRMKALLPADFRQVTPSVAFAICRDRANRPHSLCNDVGTGHPWMTVSAQFQIIDRERPDKSINYVCCGNPRRSVFLPFGISQEQSFLPLADGRLYRASEALRGDGRVNRHLAELRRRVETTALTSPAPTIHAAAWRLLRTAAAGAAHRRGRQVSATPSHLLDDGLGG
ncbi:MAG: C45 family autoproteolytic acyltransferase/hydrolase [Phycisphaerae bacterium]